MECGSYNTSREGVPVVARPATGGPAADNEDATKLKSTGVQIFVVAVGVTTPSSRHVSLASGRKFVHTVDSFDELGSLAARLAKDTCEGELFLTC